MTGNANISGALTIGSQARGLVTLTGSNRVFDASVIPISAPERRVVVIDEDSESPGPSQPGRAGDREGRSEGHPVADIGATPEDDDGAPKRRWRLFRKGGE